MKFLTSAVLSCTIIATMSAVVAVATGSEGRINRGPFQPCPFPFKESHGSCSCPADEFSLKENGTMCCTSRTRPRRCKCPRLQVYHPRTDTCYAINVADYTITVDGTVMCQDASYTTSDGNNCCAQVQFDVRYVPRTICKCKRQGEVYIPILNKCRKIRI